MRTSWIVRSVAGIMLGVFAAVSAHAQSLAWARRGGGLDIDAANAVAVDAAGNSYVTGIFSKSRACPSCGNPATFGPGQPNETILTSVAGSPDIFVAKYDNTGALVWARGAGGSGPDEAFGIAVDGAGNSYITGLSGGGADFGNGVTLPDGGGFVAKYDSSGTAVWATTLNPAGFASAIAVDAFGNITVTGSGPDPLLGGEIVTVWRVGAEGAQLWVRQATGVYSGGGTGISVDDTGNSYVVGRFFAGSATFGAGEPNETTLTDINGVGGELFVAKYDASGNLVWARQSADIPGLLAYGTGISTDSAGTSYVVGFGTTILGLGEVNETAVAGDNFVAKYDSSGSLIWAKSISGRPVEAKGIATDSMGAAYITGGFATSVTFAPGEDNQTTLVSLAGFHGADMFVAKYDAAGRFEWARQAGGGTGGLAISLDSLANAYVVGIFSGDSRFGPGEVNETVLSSSGTEWDMFVARYLSEAVGPNRPPVADDQVVITPEDTAIGITLTANDADGDPLVYTIVTGPVHGDLSGTPPNLTYTPHLNYHGPDSFTFRAFDGEDFSNIATVSITVTPVNDPPMAHGQALTTPEDTPLGVTLTGQDVDGDVLSFSVVSGPLHGTLGGTAPDLIYTPQLDYLGPDSFTFTAFDGTASSSPATVTIEVGLPNIACGSLTSGAISAAGEVDRYSFTGQAGQIMSLALASTGGFSTNPAARNSVQLTLFAASGAAVGTLRSNSQANFTLPADGTYMVRVSAANLATVGSYNVNFECLFPSQSPDTVPITCGTLGAGQIGAPAEIDLYSFPGSAGQTISLALASTGGFSTNPAASNSVQLTFFAQSGAAVGTLRSNSQANFTLPVDGTYVVRVSAANLATVGSYNVNFECLFPVQSPDTVPITCGTLGAGQIGAPAEIDLYSFPGSAGQLISLALASTGGFSTNPAASNSVQLTFFAASGAAVGTLRSNSQANFTLPVDGTYVIRVSAANLATAGSYNVNLECLFPSQSPDTVPITCGTLGAGKIGAPAQIDLYSFPGSAGQLISLALASTSGFSTNPAASNSVQLTFFAPSGAAVGTLRSNSQANFTLPADGTYVVRVSAANLATVGSYNLNLECLFPIQGPGTVLGCGTLAAGQIGAPAQIDLYSFAASAGQTISLALASRGGFSTNPAASNSVQLTVFAPAGAAVGTLRSNSQANFTLPEGGAYVVRVSAANLATIGSYNLNLECLFPSQSPDTVPITCGTLGAGQIGAPAQIDLYSFPGAAGQTISLALASTGGFSTNPAASNSVQLTFFAPSGAAVGTLRSNSQANFTLPEAGTFVVRVSAANLATVGSYNVNLECLFPIQSPDTVPITCGTVGAGQIGAPAEVDLYSFPGAAGQTISLALASTGGFSTNPASSTSVQLTVFAPSGAAVGTLRSNSQANFTLPEGGTYVVRVSAANLARTGFYTVTLGCS